RRIAEKVNPSAFKTGQMKQRTGERSRNRQYSHRVPLSQGGYALPPLGQRAAGRIFLLSSVAGFVENPPGRIADHLGGKDEHAPVAELVPSNSIDHCDAIVGR